MSERNTDDWNTLEGSSAVIIGKILADEIAQKLAADLGHDLSVDPELPVRTLPLGNTHLVRGVDYAVNDLYVDVAADLGIDVSKPRTSVFEPWGIEGETK